MKKTKRVIAAAFVVTFALCALAMSYFVPGVDIVEVVNTEVKRTNIDTSGKQEDVFYIQTMDKSRRPRVFRNEDNIFYLKYTSSDIQAYAHSVSRTPGETTVAIRHYGWRIQILSLFPNTLSVWIVAPDHDHSALPRQALFAGVAGAFGVGLWKTMRLLNKRERIATARREERARQKEALEAQKKEEMNTPPRKCDEEDNFLSSWIDKK